MTRHLSSLLDSEQDRIATAWASALSRMRPSAYVYRPLEELRRLGRAYLAELVSYLDSDDPARLREFVHREAALRFSMGFGAAEVVQGFVVFRELTQDLCEQLVPDGENLLLLYRSLAGATDFTVVEFVTFFNHLAEERTAAQQKEMQDLQRALVDEAVQDEVTDFFTSRYFDEHLAVEMKRAARYHRAFSLVVVDIDDFDELRDRYGAVGADATLRSAADALRALTRDVDIKARTDETEFSIAMPETLLEPATAVAERLRLAVGKLPVPQDAPVADWRSLRASVGVGSHPDHGSTARELLQSVRRARDQARMLGGDMVLRAEGAAQPETKLL
ncbi:MAG: GGDEF domain-containing protein [bacterium]|nr:GGDEF domain-containing protein [bacterium]